MATSDLPADLFAAPGSGGSGWEQNITNRDSRDVSTAQFVYDKTTGQYVWGWPRGDGSVDPVKPTATPASGNSPYQNGVPPASQGPYYDTGNTGGQPSNYTGRDYRAALPPSGGGGGNGTPLGWPAKIAAAAIPAAVGTIPKLFDPNGGSAPGGSLQLPPELQQLLALALKRMTDQNPLAASINAQALGGLPTSYQRQGG